ncbi:hypothetical protein NQ317_009739 [Molorchus minor]|uniref:Solute carrier family 25 member 35 n=1 Tax=Molorchus minor TaxID=1323400 RepID=A0ABQ9IY10_9CUCU|nr:hypothetical protein NQ317_009739 [Molorchus minor]
MDFAIGGLAAAGACIFSNPFDVLKTRMQLQGELRARGQHAVYYRNVFHAGWVVATNEGLRGLQKGLITAIFMHSVRNSIRLGTYQFLNKEGYLTDENGKTILYKSAIGAAFSGAVGAFVGSPLFLIKTQLQSQAAKQIAVGTQHGHKGALAALKDIYVKYGITGLWRGSNIIVLRALVGSTGQLTTFAVTKDFLKEYEYFNTNPVAKSFVASIIGGVIQTVAMNPLDLLTTRLYNQGVDAQGRGLIYKSTLDCTIKVYRAEGFLGFYKGIGANYMRLAPHGALCLVLWDILRDLQIKYLATKHNY